MSKQLSVEEFRDLIRAGEVKCELCSYKGHSMVAHLRTVHNMSAGQYQKQFPKESHPQAKLCSAVVTEMLRKMERQPKSSDDLEQFTSIFGPGVNKVPDMLLEAAKKVLKGDPAFAKHATIVKPDPHFYYPEDNLRGLLTAVLLGKHTYISGPSGCGKTEMVMQSHAQMKKPFIRMNMKGDATSSNFIGSMKADPQQGTYFKAGALLNAMRGGMTLILDEVDYTPPQIAAVMNPVLEGNHHIYVAELDETVTAIEGFCVVALGNTGGKSDPNGHYTGTEVLNTAFLDRFAVKLSQNYLPETEELNMLLRRFPAETKGHLQAMVKAAGLVRESFNQGNLSVTMSTRKLIDYCELKPTLGQDDALAAAMLNWLDADDLVLVKGFFDRAGIKIAAKNKNP